MHYLSFFMTAQPMSGPPSAEDMAKMGKLIEAKMKSGKLVYTGPLAKRESGFTVTRDGDKYAVGSANDVAWMRAGGFAVINAASREEAIAEVKEFLAVGGDGTCEILECPQMG